MLVSRELKLSWVEADGGKTLGHTWTDLGVYGVLTSQAARMQNPKRMKNGPHKPKRRAPNKLGKIGGMGFLPVE
jgi:hypothetical protein